MDFLTAHAPPVKITLNGKAHEVPRFLLPAFKAYVVEYRTKAIDEALKELPDTDRRAQFRLHYQHPPLDIAFIARELTSPEGAEHIIRTCFGKAGIAKEEIDGFISNVDPLLQRQLADELRSGNGMIAEQQQSSGDPGDAGNPLTGQPPTSGGLPTMTGTTGPTSSDSSPDAT